MASSKDQPGSRPVSGSFPRHAPPASRQHSHSISLAASNISHRVNRRKSVNAPPSSTAQAAIAAALKDQGDGAAMPLHNHRRSVGGSRKPTESHSMTARPSMHSYFAGPPTANNLGHDSDAVEDHSPDEDMQAAAKGGSGVKSRNRRASEGSYLIKGEGGKKSASDLRCDTCGKGYKHSSCLTKHLWEHDPAWAITSKLLISKHQQVQLLEAASVLCNMTSESTPPTHSDVDVSAVDPSEGSSGSPGFSSSEMHDELSSVETTPPPMSEAALAIPPGKRASTGSNGFSRSYRSIPSSSYAESVLSPGLPPHRLSGVDLRPSTSGTDDGSLAAATAGLTFNSGTPRTKPTFLSPDVPPVPPLPQQYQSYTSKSSDSTLTGIYNPLLELQPPTLTQNISDERNYRDGGRDTDIHMDDEEMFRMEE